MKKIKVITGIIIFGLLLSLSSCEEYAIGTYSSDPNILDRRGNEYWKGPNISGSSSKEVLEYTNEMIVMEEDTTVSKKIEFNSFFNNYSSVLLRAFVIGKYEVTQELWYRIMNNNEYGVDENPTGNYLSNSWYSDNRYEPVYNITWYDAVYFCNRLSMQARLEVYYIITDITVKNKHIVAANVTPQKQKNGYRLPSEAEWEFAARGGNPESPVWDYIYSGIDTKNGSEWWLKFSDDSLGEVANYSSNCKQIQKVGQKLANSLGINDMTGNINEWCYDWYTDNFSGGNVTYPTGPKTGEKKVVLGGDFTDFPCDNAIGKRKQYSPAVTSKIIGFRIARDFYYHIPSQPGPASGSGSLSRDF